MNIEKEIQQILLLDIIPNRFQPRINFEEEGIRELADSIKQHGIIQPLVLRKLGDKFEIIAGERRFKAAQTAGQNSVPAIIAELDDIKSAEIALAENIQRQNLNALEEAESFQNILRISGITQTELATRIGKSQSNIANKLRLLDLTEEAKTALGKKDISERHARSLLSIKDAETQKMFLNQIIRERMTVKETDERIKSMFGGEPELEIPSKPIDGIEDIEIIEEFSPEPSSIPTPTSLPTEIDIEKLKQQTEDIHVPQEQSNLNDLLQTPSPSSGLTNEIPNQGSGRFFQPPTPEITDMFEPTPINTNKADYQETIKKIKEFVNNNNQISDTKIEFQELNLTDHYQIILKINK